MKLWATRETRAELLMACLRVFMGAIFLAVWSDNLIKGYYSPERLGRLRAALRRHDQGEPLRRRAEQGDDPATRPSSRTDSSRIEFVVFGLFLVLGLVHAGRRRCWPRCSS